MRYIRLTKKGDIYSLLTEFLDIFPRLTDKISNIDEYAEKLRDFANVYVAKNNSENVGILVFYANDKESKEAYISLIGVKRGNTRNGIGKELLGCCNEISRKCGMSKIKLEVDQDNMNAIKFYKKNGFSFVSRSERNSFYMQREISGEENDRD